MRLSSAFILECSLCLYSGQGCTVMLYCLLTGALWLTAVEQASAPLPMTPVVNPWTTESCTPSSVSPIRTHSKSTVGFYNRTAQQLHASQGRIGRPFEHATAGHNCSLLIPASLSSLYHFSLQSIARTLRPASRKAR